MNIEKIYITDFRHNDHSITRVWFEPSHSDSDTLDMVFLHDTEISPADPSNFFRKLSNELTRNKLGFAQPLEVPEQDWVIDLDLLRAKKPELEAWSWLTGRVRTHPTFRNISTGNCGVLCYDQEIRFQFNRREIMDGVTSMNFPELTASIANFRKDHPDPAKCAFIMMRFQQTRLHVEILDAIKSTCSKYGIQALRADDHIYVDQLWDNVRTYMHGCGFGIVVFEWLTINEFNPNISLEVGYMMAQGKPIFLIKDATLPHLHTDLVGHLYAPFDPQNPADSVPPVLEAWLRNKRII